MFFKKDKDKPIIDWDLVDAIAKDIYKILRINNKITFLELDCVLNLVTTECNNAKYTYLLSRNSPGGENTQIKDVPGNLYG